MNIIKSLLGISDFWGWLQIIGSIFGIIYIYRYKEVLSKKYIKTIEKEIEKKIGIPATILFNNEDKKNISKTNKRNVSELSKKIVASNQKWKCAKCKEILDFTYEIDHIVPLYKGGGNEIGNLRALCRNCHGKITLIDRIL